MYDLSDKDNNRKSKRELVLKIIDGKQPKDSIGQIDPRLFKGDNKLYLIQEPQYMLWYFKYEQGAIPSALAEKFTKFDLALEHAKQYFKKRNVEIAEVID